MMDFERKVRMLSRSINVVYYTIYLLTIIAVVTIFFLSYADIKLVEIDPLSTTGTTISTVYMVYLLVSIPAALFLFHQKTLKLRNEKDEYTKFQKYKKNSYIRLWIIGIALVIGVVLVYVLHSQSMIFTAAIAAIALYFCKPSVPKIIKELGLDDDEPKITGKKYV